MATYRRKDLVHIVLYLQETDDLSRIKNRLHVILLEHDIRFFPLIEKVVFKV